MPRVAAAVVTVLLAVATLVWSAPATAHATLLSSDPADSAELATAPTRVTATFSEAMQQQFAAMAVVGPDGALWSTGDPAVDGAVVGVGLRPLGPAGTYTVNYRVTSADGHVVTGSWSFRLTRPGTGTPSPEPTVTTAPPTRDTATGSDGEPPIWPFLVIAALAVGGAAFWAVRRQR